MRLVKKLTSLSGFFLFISILTGTAQVRIVSKWDGQPMVLGSDRKGSEIDDSAQAIAVNNMRNSLAPLAQDGKSDAETIRIERLAAVGRLWGTVKFFHPYLAYRNIDWDEALVETLPKISAAQTPAEYLATINRLLSFLKDPATYAESDEERQAAQNRAAHVGPPKPQAALTDTNGVKIVMIMPLARLMNADPAAANKALSQINEQFDSAKGIVLDCRGERGVSYGIFGIDQVLRALRSKLAGGAVTLGSSRFRIFSGYPPRVGFTTGGYYSGFVNNAPSGFVGQQSDNHRVPVAVIINESTPNIAETLSGLQFASGTTVIEQGEPENDISARTYAVPMNEGITVHVRTSEFVNPNGSVGFRPDVFLPTAAPNSANEDAAITAAVSLITGPAPSRPARGSEPPSAMSSVRDDPYAQTEFPDKEHRLLALFRFWNVINYFYPYKHLLDEPWENVLVRFIPRFEAGANAIDYQTTVCEMVTQLHDSHGFVRGTQKLEESLGTYYPPLKVRSVAGQTVIMKLLDDAAGRASGLNVGDVLLAVDGDDVQKRIESFGRLTSASTPQSLRQMAHRVLLRGPQNSTIKLKVRGAKGEVREVMLERSLSFNEYFNPMTEPQRTTPVYGVLPSGFGYIDLARLQYGDVSKALDAVFNTSAIIFDMRGYPNGTAWAIAPRLARHNNVVGALFDRPMVQASDLGQSDYAAGTTFSFPQLISPSSETPYMGRVVMLINEEAVSQAEHTCLFFESAAKVTFVGTPTAGANGDVTNLLLPGNIQVSFSGQGVRHADGRQLQRVGIQPDITVEPTVQGVREGRDEVLGAAVEFLRKRF